MRPIRVLRALSLVAIAMAVPALAFALDTIPADHCVTRDAAGTVSLPAQCRWASGTGAVIRAVTGLPAGSELQSTYRLDFFTNIVTSPDGSGGEFQQSGARLTLHMSGTGALTGFKRTLTLPVQLRLHSGPRTPGQPVQSFTHDVVQLQGQITGDPDFDLLRIVAGSAFGLPSPGHTTLTRLAPNTWVGDSSFDLSYSLQFNGKQGSPLGGYGGTTNGFVVNAHTSAFDLAVTPNNPVGSGNVPSGGAMTAPGGATMDMLNGLPPGSPIRFTPTIDQFQLISIGSGSLGGPSYRQNVVTTLVARGEGAYGGYTKTFVLPHIVEVHVGPIVPAAPVQSFDTMTTQLQAQITGDPDFDLLRITAGSVYNQPSPGHTTLTRLPSGSWAVDSFFDIAYTIEFTGHQGGPFSGRSGSTTGTIRMNQGGIVPRVYVRAFGLPHIALGTASVVSCTASGGCPDPNVVLSYLSDPNETFWNDPNELIGVQTIAMDPNQSGVQIDLGARGQGWTGRVDMGHQGTLSYLFDLLVEAIFPGSPAMRIRGEDPNNAMFDPNSPNTLGMMYQPTGGTPPPQLQADLLLHGALMDSMTYPYPYPGSVAAGTYGTDSNNPTEFQWSIDPNDPDPVAYMRNPSPSVSKLTGSSRGPVSSDTVRLRLNGLPPGIPIEGVRVKGTHLPQLSITDESVAASDTRVRSAGTGASMHTEARAGFVPERVAVAADDIGVSGPFGPQGILLEADLDGDGEYEPLASMALDVDLGPEHELAPDGTMNWDFVGVLKAGSTVPHKVRLSARRPGGGPTALDVSVFGFDPPPITVTLRNAGTVVDSQTYPSPYPQGLVTGRLKGAAGTIAAIVIAVDVSHAGGGSGGGAGGIFVTTHAPQPVDLTLLGSSMGPVSADDIEMRIATDTLPPGTSFLDDLQRVQGSGTNLVDFALLGSSSVVLHPDVDGDGLTPDEDCDDTNSLAWSTPTEPLTFQFASDKHTLSWGAPYDPGAPISSVVYDVLRSTSPGSFASAVCIEAHDGSDRSASDVTKPPPGQRFYYLVRADNACPGTGSLGAGSDGVPRTAPPCP